MIIFVCSMSMAGLIGYEVYMQSYGMAVFTFCLAIFGALDGIRRAILGRP